MEQQYQFDVAPDAASYAVAAAPRPGVKADNRAYAVAALGSWVETVKRPVSAFDPADGAVQPIPETFAGGYVDLLG